MTLMRRVFVFDLDGTLYPSTVGTEKQIIPALLRVVSMLLGTDSHETRQIVHDLNRRYGYCVRGLTVERRVDPSELVERIYAEINIDQVAVNKELSAALCELSRFGHLAILTNSSRGHADKILRRLAIREYIHTVIGIQDLEYFLKPANEAYLSAARKLEVDPTDFIYFDDSIRNLHAAWQMGGRCVLVANGLTEAPYFWENHLRVKHLAPDHFDSTRNLPEYLMSWIAGELT